MRRDVFQATADPTRREIIKLIAYKPVNLNAITNNFDVSRPAISQHIKTLAQCGLKERGVTEGFNALDAILAKQHN